MSFRFELKLPGQKAECNALLVRLKNSGAQTLFPPRYIVSDYFDTNELDFVRESQEGSVPRRKVRIRYYPKDINKLNPEDNEGFSLEIKVSSPEGRFKTVKKISLTNFCSLQSKGVNYPEYEIIKPSVRIAYLREYFMLDGVRLTYDTKIQSSRLRDYYKYRYVAANAMRSVIELKSQNADSNLISDLTSGLRLERFSKYADCFVKI